MSRPIGGPGSTPIPQPASGVQEASKTQEAPKSNQTTTADSSSSTQQSSYEPKGKVSEHKLTGNLQQAVLGSQLEKKTNLERGMEGSHVSQLQDELIAKGYMTAEQKATGPGKFGPQTEAALKAFQRDHHLKDDGVFGPKTRKAFAEPKKQETPVKSDTSAEKVKNEPQKAELGGTKEVPDSQFQGDRSLEEQAKLYDKYSKLVPEGKLKSGEGEMNILGLRHHDIGSSKELKSYDDRFVVMWKDDAGNKRVRVFEGATHTGQTYVKDTKQEDGSYKAKFTDVTGDGRSDIAYIKPGTYEFHTGKSAKYGDHLRPDKNISAWRDTNQDGKITGNELNTNYTAGAILFHKGGTKAPQSVGCQTLSPAEYQKFIDLIKQDPNGKVTYTLVDAK
jgi:peptidoglycan hydrolase-like protein with peptidoglycan-binding domain